jgi:cell division protein FtsN
MAKRRRKNVRRKRKVNFRLASWPTWSLLALGLAVGIALIPKYDFYTILPEIETVLPDKETSAARKPGGAATPANVSYVLQAASFARFEDADHLKAKLTLNGLVAHIQKIVIEGKGEYHRVRLGPYSNLDELDAADQRLRALGIRGLRLKLKREG